MRKLILCFIVLSSFPAFAKTIILNGTLPEGATISYERVYTAKRKIPRCGRWEHWGLGIPEWVGKLKSDIGNAEIKGTNYQLEVNLDSENSFCRYYSENVYLTINLRMPNGSMISAYSLKITTLDDDGNSSIPPLQANYAINCISEEFGMPDENGQLRKVNCGRTNGYYLWGIFNVNERTYDGQPIRMDITHEYID
jgi:hypothetical protein